MADIIRRGGSIVRGFNGLITRNPSCCCPSDCCGGTFCDDHPTLYLHLTNVSGCACIDGMCIELTCVDGFWTGSGPGGDACAADDLDWVFTCESNPDGGLTDCFDFKLSFSFGVCNMLSNGYPTDCDCTGPWWEYDFTVSGIGCCAVGVDGGTFTARVDTTPC